MSLRAFLKAKPGMKARNCHGASDSVEDDEERGTGMIKKTK